jgi:hypothetical protein
MKEGTSIPWRCYLRKANISGYGLFRASAYTFWHHWFFQCDDSSAHGPYTLRTSVASSSKAIRSCHGENDRTCLLCRQSLNRLSLREAYLCGDAGHNHPDLCLRLRQSLKSSRTGSLPSAQGRVFVQVRGSGRSNSSRARILGLRSSGVKIRSSVSALIGCHNEWS